MLPGTNADSPQGLAHAFSAAMRAGDVQSAIELWADEATIVSADGQALTGRDAIGAALAAIIDNEVEVDVKVTSMFTAGSTALAVGTLTMSGEGMHGESFSRQSQSTVVYCRDSEGHWRIAIDAPWGLPSG